jgi:hypothetical protein
MSANTIEVTGILLSEESIGEEDVGVKVFACRGWSMTAHDFSS